MNNLMSKYAAVVVMNWNGKSPWPYCYNISESGVAKEWIETLADDVSTRWSVGEKLLVNTNLLRRSHAYGGQPLVDICHKHQDLTYGARKSRRYVKAVKDYWASKSQGSSVAELWSFLESGERVVDAFKRMLKSAQGGVLVSDSGTQATVSNVLVEIYVLARNAKSENAEHLRRCWSDVESDDNLKAGVRKVLEMARIKAEQIVLKAKIAAPLVPKPKKII